MYFDGPLAQADVCGTGGGEFATGPGVRDRVAPGLSRGARRRHRGARASARARRRAARRPPPLSRRSAHVCDNPLDVLYPSRRASRSRRSSSTSTATTTTAHSARGRTSRTRRGSTCCRCPGHRSGSRWGCRARDQRSARSRLHDVLQHAMGSGREGDAARGCDPAVAIRRLAGRVHGQADCVLTLAQAENVTAVFGPNTIAFHLRTTGHGTVVCTPHCAGGRSSSALRSACARCPPRAGSSRAGAGAAPVCGSRARRRPAAAGRARHVQAIVRRRTKPSGQPVAQLGMAARRHRQSPASSARNSPTVPDRSATTSWR